MLALDGGHDQEFEFDADQVTGVVGEGAGAGVVGGFGEPDLGSVRWHGPTTDGSNRAALARPDVLLSASCRRPSRGSGPHNPKSAICPRSVTTVGEVACGWMAVEMSGAPVALTATYRVLVAESDGPTASMARQCLLRAGFAVEITTTVAGAMGWIESSWPDLVVLDPHLPSEGPAAFQRVRSATDVPVVLISPRGDAHERAWGLKLGADDFVPSHLPPLTGVAPFPWRSTPSAVGCASTGPGWR